MKERCPSGVAVAGSARLRSDASASRSSGGDDARPALIKNCTSNAQIRQATAVSRTEKRGQLKGVGSRLIAAVPSDLASLHMHFAGFAVECAAGTSAITWRLITREDRITATEIHTLTTACMKQCRPVSFLFRRRGGFGGRRGLFCERNASQRWTVAPLLLPTNPVLARTYPKRSDS